ncbi:hypothetical protein [Carnobacterium viridans]|uniref:Uncharacterized protein n=2 Tax=Carnobacterium viridans TaxID=174587 RepID=A0A1H0XI24_9LACT|nr:hypothetical protein [Carnobacterium viridans]SDQ02568.1 hypothetical protein SAMN04487752_0079 [Carnobacterium viridans]
MEGGKGIYIEKWSGMKENSSILHNRQKGVILDKQSVTLSHSKKEELLREQGKPLEALRKEIIKKELSPNVETRSYLFERFLQQNGKPELVEEARTVKIEEYSTKPNQIMSELSFIGVSLAEGFLDFYGIQLSHVVEKYEKRLHIIELESVDQHESGFYIGKFTEGNLAIVSPRLDSEEQAQETLSAFLTTKQKRQKDYSKMGLEQEPTGKD